MDIPCFHKRKMKKSWLPSSILIPYAFQHDFLVLFIPMNNMRCSILSHVEDVLAKINLKVETREKKRRLYIIPLHFIKSRFQHCWMLNIEFWRIFLENLMYYGKRWLLQTYVLMKKGDPMFKINLSIVLHLISYFWIHRSKNSMINFCCK